VNPSARGLNFDSLLFAISFSAILTPMKGVNSGANWPNTSKVEEVLEVSGSDERVITTRTLSSRKLEAYTF
jgi:hypothetical protein